MLASPSLKVIVSTELLGLEGSADVTIGLPTGINISVALPPINVGNGLLRMTASSSDTSRGPFLGLPLLSCLL